PLAANFNAIARPIPLPPPVITAVLPSSLKLESAGILVLQRYASLPGNEIFLIVQFGLGAHFAARDLDHKIKNLFAGFLDACTGTDDRTSVEVDDVRHALRQRGIGRELHDRRDGITSRRAKASGKEHHARPRAYLRSHAFHVIAGGALQ